MSNPARAIFQNNHNALQARSRKEGARSDHTGFYRTRVRSLFTLVCLVNLIDVTLRCEDANSKLVEVVTVADVDAEDHVGNSLLIWELTFGHKTNLLFRL